MHALNNHRLGQWITKDQCLQAVHTVVCQLGGGDALSEHLDPRTSWLSIDVLNMLGDTTLADMGLGLQVALVAGGHLAAGRGRHGELER